MPETFMPRLSDPTDWLEIVRSWESAVAATGEFFAAIPEDAFFAAPDGAWSPAENLVHLIKSGRPVAMALRLPKLLIRLRFGGVDRPSRSFAQLRADYLSALAAGGEASGAFLPQLNQTESRAESRRRMLAGWEATGAALTGALEIWPDPVLDMCLLPHPLLGPLTVREMLFFTIYHTMHHLNDVQRLLGEPVSEWFGHADEALPGKDEGLAAKDPGVAAIEGQMAELLDQLREATESLRNLNIR